MPGESRRKQRNPGATQKYWIPHEEDAWVPGSVHREDKDKVTVLVEGGPENEHLDFDTSQFHNFQLVLPEHEVGVDDVCSLPSVPEGALLHTVRIRYRRNEIYTRVARTVIAVNPFCSLPIYSSQCMDQYMTAVDSVDLPPHIFGLSKDALQGIRLNSCNQAVLISGESGAGKTESAKLILSFVADAVRSTQTEGQGMTEKVIQTNPVMEAFGNAMTVRNNNSSRFGKWLDLAFSGVGPPAITGCRLTSYMLETTRVCGQASNERGFHVFFQLLQARNSPICSGLDLKEPSYYRYIKGGQRVAPGIDDSFCFEELCEALAQVGFDAEARAEVFRVVAGVLLLGNCEFNPDSPDEAQLADEEPAKGVAKLFGVDADMVKECFLVRNLRVGKDVTKAPLRLEQAQAARDALARLLYEQLFLYLIARMNATLTVDQSGDKGAERLLGILDIAGFESFETNSLEQLMINLSNEQLQQHFNTVVIKDELNECEAEDVPIPESLSFLDNADSVMFIDGKGGILDLLDETGAGPKPSIQAFVTSVLKQHKDHNRLITSKIARLGFGIQHYAGDVVYNCHGWLEKNANNPPDAALEMMNGSSMSCFKKMHQELKQHVDGLSPQMQGKARAKTKSVTMLLRVSLRSLAAKISEAQSHFMRCVKPNKEKVPGKLVGRMVMEQLLLSGVLATVHIRQQGYAHRIPMETFYSEYRCIGSRPIRHLSPDSPREAVREEVQALLTEFGGGQFPQEDFAMGVTKVFGKSTGVRILDNARRQAEGRRALVMQRHFRGCSARKRVRALREARGAIRDFLKAKRLLGDGDIGPAATRKNLARSRTRRLSMWFGGSTLGQLGSRQALRQALDELQALLVKAASAGLDNADVMKAQRAALRMRREHEVSIALDAPELQKCIDPVTLDKVLSRARGLALPREGTMEMLEERFEKLTVQLPLVQALKVALAHDAAAEDMSRSLEADDTDAEHLSHLSEVATALAEADLSDSEHWLPELEGAELAAEVNRHIAQAEARAKAAAEAAEAARRAKLQAEEAARAEEAALKAEAVQKEAAEKEAMEKAALATAMVAAKAATEATEAAAARELAAEKEEAASAEASTAPVTASGFPPPAAETAPQMQGPAEVLAEEVGSDSSEAPPKRSHRERTKTKLSFAKPTGRDTQHVRAALRKAADEYDAEALELLLRQADKLGLHTEECSSMAEAVQAFESLQVLDFVVAKLEATEQEAQQPAAPLSTLRRLENLARQVRSLSGNEEEAAEASEILQAALVQRYTIRGKKSIFLSRDPEEVRLGNSAFAALSQFSGLKQPKAWAGHVPSKRALALRTSIAKGESSGMLIHTKVCIDSALTQAPHGADPEEYEAGAIQNFRNLLVWMCDRPAQACQRRASFQAVLMVARMEPALRSEVYLQVLKQVSGNPSPRSVRLGWELLHALCLDAPPPPEVSEFVRAAFRDAAADPESEAAGMASACRALLDRPSSKMKLLGAGDRDELSLVENVSGGAAMDALSVERYRQAEEIKQLKEEMARLRGTTARRGTGFFAQFCCALR